METPFRPGIAGLEEYLQSAKEHPSNKIINQLQSENAALRQRLARSEELLEYEKTSNQNNVEMYEMRCRELEKHSKQLIIALEELVDLMQGVIDGDYEPDSFTLQFAREVLKGIPESIENQPTCEERLARLVDAAEMVINNYAHLKKIPGGSFTKLNQAIASAKEA